MKGKIIIDYSHGGASVRKDTEENSCPLLYGTGDDKDFCAHPLRQKGRKLYCKFPKIPGKCPLTESPLEKKFELITE